MRLLLTNDDSIESVFLHELVAACQRTGHDVAVAAPRSEQSWIGAAKSRHRPVKVVHTDRGLGCPTWIVDGTPSDCVNIALAHLLPRDWQPDAVLSGINMGFNASLGFILASGTIAGAWEGAVHGLPGIAVSQDLPAAIFERLKSAHGQPDEALHTALRLSAARAAALVPELVAATAPRSFTVHNLNLPYPCTAGTAVRRTVPARVVVPGLFGPAQDDGTHCFVFQQGEDISPPDPMTDRGALVAGLISHTVLDYRELGHPRG